MSNDPTRWKPSSQDRNQNDSQTGQEVPGDTDAADIVGRTGEEMPEIAHDELADIDAQNADSLPRADEGQLGPDELPDPSEVIRNQEAKLHH